MSAYGTDGGPREDDWLRRRLARSSATVTVGCLLATVSGVLVAARFGTDGLVLHPLPAIAWAVAGAIVAGALGLVGARLEGGEAAAVTTVLLVLNLCVDTAIAASGGGVAGPLWVLFLPVVLYVAVAVPTGTAALVGTAAAVGVVVASSLAHTLDPGNAWRLCLILPALPATAWFVATVGTAVRRASAAARAQHAQLADDVHRLTTQLARIAEGDLTRVGDDPPSAPSTEQLAAALAKTRDELAGLVRQVTEAGGRIAYGVKQLQETAGQHAEGAAEQNAAAVETTSTMAELAATAAQIAQTAHEVSRRAAGTVDNAEHGRDAVAASMDASVAIAGRMDLLGERVREVEARSREIERILAIIDDLAERSNLLAINASIEAAHAGEHGRGFGVVAQEIRVLAERARAFTDQIKGLVRDIHGATGATLEANEQATQDALVGTRLAEQAMTVLDRIAQEVRRTGLAADEIAAATAQQRAASDQVAAAMAQVARVSTQHANGTQQLARSVAAQHEMAERMRTVIDRFRLD